MQMTPSNHKASQSWQSALLPFKIQSGCDLSFVAKFCEPPLHHVRVSCPSNLTSEFHTFLANCLLVVPVVKEN